MNYGMTVNDFISIEDELANEDKQSGSSANLFLDLLQKKFTYEEVVEALDSLKGTVEREREIQAKRIADDPRVFSCVSLVNILIHALRFQEKTTERLNGRESSRD